MSSHRVDTLETQSAKSRVVPRRHTNGRPQVRIVIIRSTPRFTVSLLVAFSGDHEGVGMIRNLSINGCCISSGTVMNAGESVNLRFHPGDDGPVIAVDLAEVRWATAWDFGVVFQSLQPAEQQRLLHFITTLPSA